MYFDDTHILHHRRRLPHWQTTPTIYFVTWRLRDGQPELAPTERDIVVSSLRFFEQKRYRLFAFVAMNDHVHVLFSILGDFKLPQILHSWKSFTAHQLQRLHGRRGAIWQPEYFDRLIRDEREFIETMNYIEKNPFRRWPALTEYRWMWVPEHE
jgi:putative transposase